MSIPSLKPWRLVGKALVCLVFGAGCTCAVTFACVMYSPTGPAAARVTLAWYAARPIGAPDTVTAERSDPRSGFGVEEWVDAWKWTPRKDERSASNVVFACFFANRSGWPWRAFETRARSVPLTCRDELDWATSTKSAFDNRVFPLERLPSFLHCTDPLREVPTRPLWAGLVADTSLYGLVAAGFVFGIPVTRAAVRRRAGGCPACGYPRGVGDRCTECGRVHGHSLMEKHS